MHTWPMAIGRAGNSWPNRSQPWPCLILAPSTPPLSVEPKRPLNNCHLAVSVGGLDMQHENAVSGPSAVFRLSLAGQQPLNASN
jgi:hypothetical protein